MHCNKYSWKHGMELCKLPHWCFFPLAFWTGLIQSSRQIICQWSRYWLYCSLISFIMVTSLSEQNHKIVKRWKNPKSQSRNFEYWNMWWKSLNSWWGKCRNTENFCGVVWDSFELIFMNSTEKENNTFCKVTTWYAFSVCHSLSLLPFFWTVFDGERRCF